MAARAKRQLSWLIAWRWYLGLGLIAFLVLFRIHGVSLESWNAIVKDTTPFYRYPSLGANRPIRSDEYAVSVPFVMAQCAHPDFFPRVNERIDGTGMDMLVSTPPSPVWDWTVVGQAANWGYFLFGFERGLSWNWWARYLLGFLFALEFFLVWLRRDRSLALVAALVVTLGAPTQWWTTTVPYLNLFFFASLVFIHKLFSWHPMAARIAAGIGATVSLSSFSFSLYPPFQLLYGVALILLGAEMIWIAHRRTDPRPRTSTWLILACVVLVLVGEWCYFFTVHHETLSRLASSSYPGDRCCLGGGLKQYLDMQTWKIVSLFTSFRAVGFRNACVVSVFFVPMFACVWGAIRAGKRFVRESPFGLALAGWAGAMLLWMAFTWPEKLSRLSFFSQIKIERAAVVSSFILLLLVFKLAQVTMRGRHICCGKLTVAGCLGLSYSLLALSLFVNPAIMNYFVGTAPLRGVAMLALGALLLAMVTVGLLRCNRWAFMGGYAAVALLSGAYVNPVSRGAAPLKEKQLTEAIHGVVRGHGGGTWLCSSATIAQFVRAQGLACINGVQQTADTEFWRRIDPTERFKFAWNRYAHVSASIAPPGKVSAIVNPMAGDCITWALDVAAIRTLDVRYLLWSGKKIREPWVEYLGRIRLNFIYKVRDPPLSCRQPDPSVPKEPNVRKPSE